MILGTGDLPGHGVGVQVGLGVLLGLGAGVLHGVGVVPPGVRARLGAGVALTDHGIPVATVRSTPVQVGQAIIVIPVAAVRQAQLRVITDRLPDLSGV